MKKYIQKLFYKWYCNFF